MQFIQFGCWNNLNIKEKDCKIKEKGCLKESMTMLHDYIHANTIKRIIVSGDNYYPDKQTTEESKKIKIINTELLTEGFKLLPKEIPITMILGNHDLETNQKNQNGNILEKPYKVKENHIETPEKGDCKILKTQLESIHTNTNVEYCFYKDELIADHTLVITLDTSIYDIADREDYLTCYKMFLNRTHNDLVINTIDDIVKHQASLIEVTMRKKIDVKVENIIIVGHHPIIQSKLKKDKPSLLSDINLFKNVLLSMYRTGVKYYYLCSDLHLYQTGIVTIAIDNDIPMIIEQYISGIGGTELDKGTGIIEYLEPLNGITYEMTGEKESCGFLVCDYSKPELSFTPHFTTDYVPDSYKSVVQFNVKQFTVKHKTNKKHKTKGKSKKRGSSKRQRMLTKRKKSQQKKSK